MKEDARRGDRLPHWQDQPCPPWCSAPHADADAHEDRIHRSEWQARVPLSLAGRDAVVSVEQHYQDAQPTVWLDEAGDSTFQLTTDEARAIADQLTKAADLAEGHWGGDA